jgi:hypothetical protein
MAGVLVLGKITKSRDRLRSQCIWNSQELLALVVGLPKPHGGMGLLMGELGVQIGNSG